MDPRSPGNASRLSRRTLIKRAGVSAGALAGLPALLAACGGGDSGSSTTTAGTTSSAPAGESPELTRLLDSISSDQVVIGSFGGTTEEARRAAFWDPFEQRTGVKVVTGDLPGNLGENMIMGRVRPRMDAYHASAYQVLRAVREGARPLPRVPEIAYEDLLPEEFQPYSFQSFFLAYVPAMLPDTFDEAPRTWADFFDVRKFPGKRAWPGPANTPGTREAALMADGVPPDEVFPLDLERAAYKIRQLVPHMVVYNEFPQAQSLLTSRTVSMSFAANGLWKGLQDRGVDLTVLWDIVPILHLNQMAPLPDSPNPDVLPALAAFCNDPERQAAFAKATNYGPPSRAAFEFLSEEEADALPNRPGREVCISDPANLAENQAQMLEDNKRIFS